MRKRIADWFEKISVGLMVGGFFQLMLMQNIYVGIISELIGLASFAWSLFLTYIESRRT